MVYETNFIYYVLNKFEDYKVDKDYVKYLSLWSDIYR